MSRLSNIQKTDLSVPTDLPISKIDDVNQIVYGVVYEPLVIDTDGETITKEHVMSMAWKFISDGNYKNIDIQHNFKKSGAAVVESFIARKGDEDFPVDSWVLGVQVPNEIWEQVIEGNLNGFSLAGQASKSPARVIVEIEKQIVGITQVSTVDILPAHKHNYVINYNIDGQVVSGKTDSILDHFHSIKMETASEKSLDHNHRFEV